MIRRLRDWWAGRGRRGAQGKVDADLDWAPGDLAECILRGQWLDVVRGPLAFGPQYGERYRGTAGHAALGVFGPAALPGLALSFAPWPTGWWHASSFRKVQPRADLAEAADQAFIASLKPARIPETAR